MNLIAEAERALVRNGRVVLAYVLASIVIITVYLACESWLHAIIPRDSTPKPRWYILASLSLDLGQAVGIAALQAIAFARIGSEMDRPLWKHGGAADAMRNFFSLWLIIALIFFAISQLQWSFYQQGLQDAVIALELPRLFWLCISVPVGVCIMYGGALKWEEVPERLSPLLHLFPRAMIAFLLGFTQYFLYELAVQLLSPPMRELIPVRVAIQVPIIFLECLIFAVTWLICMEYRDTAEEREDDFDF